MDFEGFKINESKDLSQIQGTKPQKRPQVTNLGVGRNLHFSEFPDSGFRYTFLRNRNLCK